MATTTNYGWTTPDDTALVKDGASAIRSLGTSIDTTTKNLNPSTTLGDIEYRSSTANTNTRLAIGTTGQVLTVSGGVPSWATSSSGGLTLISTTTLSGSSVTLSSIPQTYTDLKLVLSGMTNATTYGYYSVKPNNDGTLVYAGGYGLSGNALGLTPWGVVYQLNTGGLNATEITFNNYASTTAGFLKPFHARGGYQDEASQRLGGFSVGLINLTTTAITSLVIASSGGSFNGGTALLYGVK